MRLVTYARNEHTGIGVRLPDGVAPIEGYATMLDLIRSGQEGLDAAARAADSSLGDRPGRAHRPANSGDPG